MPVENGRGRWEGDEVVWQFTVPQDGKAVSAKIVWAEKGKRSGSRENAAGKTLMATSRFSLVSRAR